MTRDAKYVLPAPAERVGQTRAPLGEAVHLRIPRNSNINDTLDDLHAQYSSLLKTHSPVPSRRPSLIRLWWPV